MRKFIRSTATPLRNRSSATSPTSSRCITSKSSTSSDEPPKDVKIIEHEAKKVAATQKSTQTIAERDAEIQRKLAGISGDGGESGVEYEDGKPAAMKRSVKNNMFRLI